MNMYALTRHTNMSDVRLMIYVTHDDLELLDLLLKRVFLLVELALYLLPDIVSHSPPKLYPFSLEDITNPIL